MLKYLIKQTKTKNLRWASQKDSGEYVNDKKNTLKTTWAAINKDNIPTIYLYVLESTNGLISIGIFDVIKANNGYDIGNKVCRYSSFNNMIEGYYIRKLLKVINHSQALDLKDKITHNK